MGQARLEPPIAPEPGDMHGPHAALPGLWPLFVPQCPRGRLCSADWVTKSCWSPGAGPHSPLPAVLSGREVRWCTTSDPEQQKCSDMSHAFQRAGIQPALRCVQGPSADHCIQLITVSPLLPLCSPPADCRPLTQEGAHNSLIHREGHWCPPPGLGDRIS